jgi:transposase
MEQVTTIGLDIAKHVFHAHGADERGRTVFSRKVSRAKLISFFAGQPCCVVALEACAGAHHWGRQLERLGHEVRLIPPAYVKPFVKRQKNDAADAEAICEAAQRPSMRFVAVKSEAQQASALVFRARDLVVRQRTQLANGGASGAVHDAGHADRARRADCRAGSRDRAACPRGRGGPAADEHARVMWHPVQLTPIRASSHRAAPTGRTDGSTDQPPEIAQNHLHPTGRPQMESGHPGHEALG